MSEYLIPRSVATRDLTYLPWRLAEEAMSLAALGMKCLL
jgi:hypothetical protein